MSTSAMECASCKQTLHDPEIKCSVCDVNYHFSCANVTETAFRKWSKEKKQSFKCSTACRSKARAEIVSSPSSSPQPNMMHIEFDKDNTSMQAIAAKIAELCASVNELTKSVKFQSQKFDSLLKAVSDQDEKIQGQEKILKQQGQSIVALEDDNARLRKKLEDVELRAAKLDQYGRNRNVEISGVQERHGEDLTGIVLEMAKLLKINCGPQDIDIVHRIKKDKNKRNPIIVQFTTRTARDAWLKKRKTGLSSNNIVNGSDDEEIYVNCNLSKYHSNLFWKARMANKQLKYKYCWVSKSGEILMKKDDNISTKPIKIETERDLPKKN